MSFCEFCGADLRRVAIPNMSSTPQAAALAQPQMAAPSAAEVAQLGKSLLKSLSLGEKFAAGGVIAAVLGFFLPFLSAPDLGPLTELLSKGNPTGADLAHASVSLFEASKILGVIYFLLLAAIGSGVLFYFSRKAPYAQKMLMSGFQVMIGSLFGPTLIAALFFVPMVQSVAGAGYWLVSLGYCCIAAGGLITIGHLAKVGR